MHIRNSAKSLLSFFFLLTFHLCRWRIFNRDTFNKAKSSNASNAKLLCQCTAWPRVHTEANLVQIIITLRQKKEQEEKNPSVFQSFYNKKATDYSKYNVT